MGVCFYYLPRVARQEITRDRLLAAGLGTVFADLLDAPGAIEARITAVDVRGNGPDGRQGVIVLPTPVDGPPAGQPIGYHPERQDWEECEAGHWLGVDRERPPTPEALRRPEALAGYEHTLGDGQVWICPIIRRCFVHPMVPRRYRRRGGELQGDVLARYSDVWDASAKWAANAYAATPGPIADRFDGAVECLSLNYRVGAEEVGRLGLLDDRTIAAVLDAAIDGPWLAEALDDPEKKKAVESVIRALASSSPGAGDCSPATPPAGPT